MTTRPSKTSIESTLLRYQQEILAAMRAALQHAEELSGVSGAADTPAFYGQMRYHLGWVDATFAPATANQGKLLRPTLLLLAYEAAGANGLAPEGESTPRNRDYLARALPAAAALELTHNFTLIHDDIVDSDPERRHRATLWKMWGIPQAINTGDGLFALARLALWDVLKYGVEADIAARLGAVLDRACLVIAEGQFLDINFERCPEIAVTLYIDMIRRKTAELMACATEMGGLLGTRDMETVRRLRSFGEAMGIAFQIRDDILGVWASSEEYGKPPAGDILRRKKSLPILHALEHASPADQQALHQIYAQQEPVSDAQVRVVLAIFARTETRAYCRAFLAEQCRRAYAALAAVPRHESAVAARALRDMERLVAYLEAASRED
jgi:geranylgeranyl diphosphate synthase type I